MMTCTLPREPRSRRILLHIGRQRQIDCVCICVCVFFLVWPPPERVKLVVYSVLSNTCRVGAPFHIRYVQSIEQPRTSSLFDEGDSVLSPVLDLLSEAVVHEEPPRVLVDSFNHLLFSPDHLDAGKAVWGSQTGNGMKLLSQV